MTSIVLREIAEGLTLKKLDYYFLKAFRINDQVNLVNHLFTWVGTKKRNPSGKSQEGGK